MKKLFQLVGYITIDGIQKSIKKLDAVEKKARKAIRPIQRFGQQTAQIGKELSMKFTVPLAIAGGAIVKFGADFEKSMTNSLAIMGKSADSMRDKMEKTARGVAKTSTYNATQAAEAYYFLASAGLGAAQSMEALPRVARFAQAGNFDLALATDLLTDAQSALGLSSKDTAKSMLNMERVSDVLVKANTIANASVQQFSESLTNKAGAALRLLGKDVKEGVAVLAVYADQGKKGAEAGTSLDIVLRDLQKAAINNGKAFKEANVAVFDEQEEMRNLADIISDLETRFGGMSDKQRRAELMTLGFTEKSVSATAALIGTSDAIREYEEKLKNANGITKEVADKQLKSLWAQLTIVKNKLSDVAIELSSSLIPILSKHVVPLLESFARKLSALAKWFTSLPAGVQKTTISLTAMVFIVGPLIFIIGKLISSITLVTTAIKAAKLAVIAFNTTLSVSPFILAATAIVGIAIAIDRTGKAWKKWSDDLEENIAQKQTNALKNNLEAIIPLYGELVAMSSRGILNKEDAERFKLLSEEVKNAEINIADLGEALEGGLVARMNQAENQLTDMNEELAVASETTDDYAEAAEVAVVAVKKLSVAAGVQEEWAEKLKLQGKEGIALLKAQQVLEVDKAIKAGENAATIAAINKFYINEIAKAEEELTKKKEKEEEKKVKLAKKTRKAEIGFMNELRIAVMVASGDELKALEMRIAAEKKAAEESLSIQEELDTAKFVIDEKYYEDLQRLREEDQQNKSIIGKVSNVIDKFFNDERVQLGFQMFAQFRQMRQMNTQNKIDEIDKQKAKDIQHVKDTVKDKDQQEKEITKINEAADKKKKALAYKQAKRDKAAAVFQTAIAAIQLAMNGFMTKPFLLGLIMGGIATAIGIGLVAAVASKPLPALAEGAYIPQTPGGRQVRVSEGNDAEAILPMRKGTAEIARGILDKIGNVFSPGDSHGSRPAFARAGGGGSSRGRQLRPIQHVWHIGTLVADNAGIKELERRQLSFRVSEEQRKGDD